jgi:acetyl esterase/lipase
MAPTYGGDPGRLFLVGHSAGAYNAMMVTLAPEFLAAEGLSPSVIRGLAAISGPYDFKPLSTNITLEAFAGTKDFAPTQPVNRVTPDSTTPPILLLQGASDKLVRPRHTRKMAEVLRRNGKSVETIYYKGAGHARPILALGEPLQARLPILDDIVSFFARVAPQPAATATIQG